MVERTRRVDPRVKRTRAAAVSAATDLFTQMGYLGTSMDMVAEAAGVSKRTLYNNYASKEQLFREVVMVATTTAEAFAADVVVQLAGAEHLEGSLYELARRLAQTVTRPELVRRRRLLIAEADRFPELAAEYYRSAPGAVMTRLAQVFADLADSEHLRVTDPARAAEHFAFLVLGPALDRALFDGTDDPPASDAITDAADDGVRVFLTAYRAE